MRRCSFSDRQNDLPPGVAAATEFQRLFGLRQGNFLGKTKDENLTASEMGNSPEVIIKHYRALVRDADVTRYWHLAPGNVQLDSTTPTLPA